MGRIVSRKNTTGAKKVKEKNQVRTNYVLIDFENVQPKNLDLIAKHPFKIFVFVGDNQAKVPFDLALAMQNLGENAKYIKISGNGQNALDFHIAFYIGRFSLEDPEGYFHIISKDKGFDPLVNHLRRNGIKVYRQTGLAKIPVLKILSSTNDQEKSNAVIKNISVQGKAKPGNNKTLSKKIDSPFPNNLKETELASVIKNGLMKIH